MQLNGASDQKGHAPHQKGHDADLYFPTMPCSRFPSSWPNYKTLETAIREPTWFLYYLLKIMGV
jgi:murein endopeptidase